MWPAASRRAARSSRVVVRNGSTEWMRNGSTIVLKRGSMTRTLRGQRTMTALPPRRGSAAPDIRPVSGSCSTACAPPKNRLRLRKRSTGWRWAISGARSTPGSA